MAWKDFIRLLNCFPEESAFPEGFRLSSELLLYLHNKWQANAGLQLRRAISIQAEGIKLLEKDAIAPSAAGLCCARVRLTGQHLSQERYERRNKGHMVRGRCDEFLILFDETTCAF